MAPPNEKVLYVLTGPTAVGKTELALRWAEQNQAEIVSCDSLLFYRGMDIGTAKPTPSERARVRHHLVDVCDITERMDVTRYVQQVRATLDALALQKRSVLVTGGSGFYLRCFFAPVADDVEVPGEIRGEVARKLEKHGLPALVAELRALNSEGIQGLDTDNPRRVVRALERCLVSGRTLKSLAEEFAAKPRPFADWETRLVRLDREPAELAQRITERVQSMLEGGLIEEVRQLLERGLRANPSAAKAIGYRETIDMIDGLLPPDQLAEAIAKNTRALVKKQRTWFRTQLPEHKVISAGAAQPDTLF
jgi:tRNA dimethylallyltransferase